MIKDVIIYISLEDYRANSMRDLVAAGKDSVFAPSPASLRLPAVVEHAGDRAKRRYFEFFTAQIRNPNTRMAYGRAVRAFFDWCARYQIELEQIEPALVAAYVEELGKQLSAPTVKQHLAAIRMLFNWLVVGQVVPMNPAAAVRGPKHIVRKGKTPVLQADEARMFLESIPTDSIGGLRDRALIAVMMFSFARIGAACSMNVGDYYHLGRRGIFRLNEKGGKHHEVPAHHKAVELVDVYKSAGGFAKADSKTPLFRALDRRRALSDRRLHPQNALAMIKRRAAETGFPPTLSCHTFRATGITNFLINGGQLEEARRIAAHESSNTTRLYDRSGDEIDQADIERIRILS